MAFRRQHTERAFAEVLTNEAADPTCNRSPIERIKSVLPTPRGAYSIANFVRAKSGDSISRGGISNARESLIRLALERLKLADCRVDASHHLVVVARRHLKMSDVIEKHLCDQAVG